MGTRFLQYYNENVKKSWKIAFWSAFVIGAIIHLFKFVNVLPNKDAMLNFYNSQNMVASGRWLLGLACELGTRFDLPWVNGVLSLLFAGVAAAVIAEHFRMDNPCLIVVSSGLLVSFPSFSFTMTYGFTADGYMIAMVLAAIGALMSRVEDIRRDRWKQLVVSRICICLSCGIYQAFISFSFAMAVCDALLELIEGRTSIKKILTWILVELLIYGSALLAYYGIWKVCLLVQNVQVTNYQGMDDLGILGEGGLIGILYKIIKDCYLFFFQWNIFQHGITRYSLLNILFFVALAIGLVIAVIKSGAYKSAAKLLLIALLLISFPFGCYIWYFVSDGVDYHSIMLQSFCILYIFLAVLYERWGTVRKADLVCILLSAIVFNNSLSANIFYTHMHMTYERSYAKATEMMTRIHLLDDGTVRNIALCGHPESWEQEDTFDPETLREIGGNRFVSRDLTSYYFMMLYTDLDLAYYNITGEEHPVLWLFDISPAPYDQIYYFPALPLEEQRALEATSEYAQMPIWPAEGSVRRIGDTIVIKLSD